MKKITFLLLMLLSITAFSQVEVVENFDNVGEGELPTNWSENNYFRASSEFACGGTGNSATTALDSSIGLPLSDALISPYYSAVTNNTDLTVSFSVNVFERTPFFVFPASFTAPLSGWGSVTLEYSIDNGTSWTPAYTVDDSNFTFIDTGSCVEIPAINLGPLAAGSDFQARFVATAENVIANSGNFLMVVIDNISITQVATTVPNCNATLTSPANGSSTADLDDTLKWQNATGIPTGYKVSIGTTSGGTDILNAATTTDTSYPLAGLGLAYNTEYFVNIVPYNSFGDANTGCIEESFTTRMAPIPGATCSSPLEVTSFPYIKANDNTANYENNINVGPCGGYSGAYMNGYDVFYEITPATDISINISLAGISENGAAIHVMEGCPDTSTNCLGLIGDSWSNTPPYTMELNDIVLSAGHSYFIVLSSSGNNSSFSYQVLLINQNSCINPSMTLTPVSDCANGQFNVDVDITSLGSASSLTLTDNFGNSNTTITSTGIVSMGPYTSTSNVDFTLTNNDDDACSYNDSTFFYCPPVNDDCADSIALTVNTDGSCTILTSATNAGATESASNPVTCDFTNNNDVWFSFVATNTTLILEYLNVTAVIGDGNTNQATELLEGSCNSFTSLGCFTGQYVSFNNLTIGNTYYIRNDSNSAGNFAQNYDICLKTPPAPPANDECANAIALTVSTDENCDNLLSSSTLGGTPSAENTCNSGYTANWKDVWYVFTASETGLYKFSFSRTGYDPGADYFIYSGTCGALVAESPYCGHGNEYNTEIHSINSGESVYVMVRSGDNGPGIDFGLCVFKLPPATENNDCSTPTTLIESTDANGNNMISGDLTNAYPSSEACDSGATTVWYSFTPTYTGSYHFNLTPTDYSVYYTVFNTDDCSQTSNNFVPNDYCYRGPGALDTELVAGNTYLISVFAFNSNPNPFNLLVYPDASLSVESNSFETFKYYPNPVINTLTLEAKNIISSVSVFNIVGQQVQLVTPNSLTSTLNMDQLRNGMYFVTVTINGSQKTIKVVKK